MRRLTGPANPAACSRATRSSRRLTRPAVLGALLPHTPHGAESLRHLDARLPQAAVPRRPGDAVAFDLEKVDKDKSTKSFVRLLPSSAPRRYAGGSSDVVSALESYIAGDAGFCNSQLEGKTIPPDPGRKGSANPRILGRNLIQGSLSSQS